MNLGVDTAERKDGDIPLAGDYEPSTGEWVRDLVTRYEANNRVGANDLFGSAVIILMTVGVRSGEQNRVRRGG